MEKLQSINEDLKVLFKNTSFEDYSYEDFDNADDLIENIRQQIWEEDIIYYARAMDYLRENDCGLQYSMELAYNLGYECKNLNSEILATILYQDNLNDELNDLINDIEEIFDNHEE